THAPTTYSRLVDLVEAIEHAVDLLPPDADPVVLDRQHDRVPVAPRPHDDGFALAGELDGVVEQVDEQLAKALLVAADRRQVARDGTLERHPLAIREQPDPVDRAPDDRADVDRVEVERHRALLDRGQIEQLVDHLDEMARLDVDLQDPVAHTGREVDPLEVPRERLREEADVRQRRPQLMGEVVDELRADALEAA